MKKIFLVLLICLIPALASAQGTPFLVTEHHEITFTLTGTETQTIYWGFYGYGGGTSGFSETAIDPKDMVITSGDFNVYGTIDSASTSTESDSLRAYVFPLGHDGYPMGGDTLWFDWSGHTTTDTRHNLDWTPWNRSSTLGVTPYTFWINLTNKYPPCNGFKFVFIQNSYTDELVSTVTLNAEAVR